MEPVAGSGILRAVPEADAYCLSLFRFWMQAKMLGVPPSGTVRLRHWYKTLQERATGRLARPEPWSVGYTRPDHQKAFFQGVAAAEGGSNALKERGGREHRH